MPRHRYLCPMRWADMDGFGHINNSAFFAYLEQARIDLFWEHAKASGADSVATGVVIARHEIDYRRPVVYRKEPLAIDLWCSKVGNSSLTVSYEVYDDEKLAVEARTICVPYDLEAGRVRRLTDVERDFLKSYLD